LLDFVLRLTVVCEAVNFFRWHTIAVFAKFTNLSYIREFRCFPANFTISY